ncbi:MAG: cytochrome c3 family protein [Acidobacteriota bacterium]
MHTHRSTTCLSCHAAHHYREKKFLLVEAPPQLCTNCHDRR